MLIENYNKFMNTRTKFFKSPILNLDRYGFTMIDEEFFWKMTCKPKQYLQWIIKSRNITSGHIVFRYTTHTWGEKAIEIWYNEKILDKYGNILIVAKES
jgi:hypothetical protein